MFSLPDLSSFLEDNTGQKALDNERDKEERDGVKIDRSNREEYSRVLQLNPFADGKLTYFIQVQNLVFIYVSHSY